MYIEGSSVKGASGQVERVEREKNWTRQTSPDQWLVAKTIPICKHKGESNDIKNCRTIDNLCSSSKCRAKHFQN